MTKPKGKTMEGVGRHYSNTANARVRGHSLVQGLYVLLVRRCPLAPHLSRRRPHQAEKADHGGADGGEHLGGSPAADLGAILVKGDITDRVGAVSDRPVPADVRRRVEGSP